MTHETRVVFGPRTRLGQMLLGKGSERPGTDVAIARHDADRAALADGAHRLLSPESDEASFREVLAGDGPVKVRVCALGPLHPGTPDQAATSAGVTRDLGLISRVLDACADRPVHVVLVSTAVALSPAVDRRYYGGWKGVVEQELTEMVAASPANQMSVLYPGRLVPTRDLRHPVSLLYTTYRGLAELVDRTGDSKPAFRVVGADARAWLVTRAISMGVSGITGRPGKPGSLTERAVRVTRSAP